MNRLAVGMVVLVLTCACTLVSFLRPLAPPSGLPKIEFQNARFDGEHLTGRLLVGATGGPILIDARLTVHSVVHVEGVFDCQTEAPVPFLLVDSITTEPEPGDLLMLKEGHWYGADIDFLVLAEEITNKPSPDCILAKVVFRTESGAGADGKSAETMVRVERTTRSDEMD